MKTLVTLFITFFSITSSAIVFDGVSNSSAKSVVGYTQPQVHGIELMKADQGIVVKSEFLLSGCLNEITPVTQTVVKTKDELVVVLSALEIQIPASDAVKCIQANIKEAAVFVPVDSSLLEEYGKSIKVQFAKTNQVFQIMDNQF